MIKEGAYIIIKVLKAWKESVLNLMFLLLVVLLYSKQIWLCDSCVKYEILFVRISWSYDYYIIHCVIWHEI
jgi:hypothetical protein